MNHFIYLRQSLNLRGAHSSQFPRLAYGRSAEAPRIRRLARACPWNVKNQRSHLKRNSAEAKTNADSCHQDASSDITGQSASVSRQQAPGYSCPRDHEGDARDDDEQSLGDRLQLYVASFLNQKPPANRFDHPLRSTNHGYHQQHHPPPRRPIRKRSPWKGDFQPDQECTRKENCSDSNLGQSIAIMCYVHGTSGSGVWVRSHFLKE